VRSHKPTHNSTSGHDARSSGGGESGSSEQHLDGGMAGRGQGTADDGTPQGGTGRTGSVASAPCSAVSPGAQAWSLDPPRGGYQQQWRGAGCERLLMASRRAAQGVQTWWRQPLVPLCRQVPRPGARTLRVAVLQTA